jgi:hypothetical protein
VAITFSIPNTEIIVTSGQTTATCQEIYDASRLFEEQFRMMGFDHIVDAGGKLVIDKAGGVFTEIVMSLRDPWTIRFEDEDTAHCAVRGGTLLAFDAVGDPRPVSTNFGLTINQSVSGTLVDSSGGLSAVLAAVNRNADLIESQNTSHTWQGDTYWVDPDRGGTLGGGATGVRDNPLNTVTEALTLVTDSNHDMIQLVSGVTPGPTTLTEDVVINKRYVFIRGPGRDFIWTRSGPGHTIEVTAEGVQLSKFQVETTAVTGAGAGIRVNGAPFCKIDNVWVNQTRGSGIEISNSDNSFIENCTVDGAGVGGSGHGIEVTPAGGSSKSVKIFCCHVVDVPGDGIRLFGDNVDSTIIEDCKIHQCTGWGISLSETEDVIISRNVIGENGAGDISRSLDLRTIQENNEQWHTQEPTDKTPWSL